MTRLSRFLKSLQVVMGRGASLVLGVGQGMTWLVLTLLTLLTVSFAGTTLCRSYPAPVASS